jgi:hypothetical protein
MVQGYLRRVAYVTLGCLVVALLVSWLIAERRGDQNLLGATGGVAESELTAPSAGLDGGAPPLSSGASVEAAQSLQSPPERRAAAPIPPELPRFDAGWGAETPEESAWLERNGFPDTAALEQLTSTPEEQLRYMAAQGNRHAQRIADYKALRRTAGDPAFEEGLFAAAADGDVFALQLLAWYHLQAPGAESRVIGLAYNRVLGLRGYYPAVLASHMYLDGLSGDHLVAVDVYSLVIFNRLQDMRMQRVGVPFPVSPRPGLDQLFAGAQSALREIVND